MIANTLTLLAEKKAFFFNLLLEHIQISLASIAIAAVLGLLLGIFISEKEKCSRFVLGAVNLIYTIPSIALLGFLIPFSGIGNPTAILALTVYALLPMVRNTYTGIHTIDPILLEAARGMGSTDGQILWKIKLPLALPVILSGLRNMTTMTIALAGIASFIGAGGLGVAIYRGITTNNSAMTLAGSLLIALLALIADGILGLLEKAVTRKKAKSSRKNKALAITAGALCFLIFGAIVLNNLSHKGTIHLATKPMTEQYIVGYMLKEVIEEETELTVEMTQGVGGGTSNIMPGMESGKFDMYPEYTSTGWNMVLNHEGLYTEEMYPKLTKEYQEKYNFTWTGIFGFNDSFGLAVRKDIAEKYNLKTYSDLAKVSSKLTFGGEYDFYERPDGYDALCKTYQFQFSKTVDLDIGLKYQAINSGKVDVMDVFTTDGQLSTADVIVLKDDRTFFSSAMCAMVVRQEVLDKYPELQKALDKLEGVLDDREMARLNDQVESKGKDAQDVAHDFLISRGLIK